MPLYGTGYVFSKVFFRFWVVWTFLWAWSAALIITVLPLWQGRRTLWHVARRMLGLHIDTDKGVGSTGGSESAETEVVVVEADPEKKAG